MIAVSGSIGYAIHESWCVHGETPDGVKGSWSVGLEGANVGHQ